MNKLVCEKLAIILWLLPNYTLNNELASNVHYKTKFSEPRRIPSHDCGIIRYVPLRCIESDNADAMMKFKTKLYT